MATFALLMAIVFSPSHVEWKVLATGMTEQACEQALAQLPPQPVTKGGITIHVSCEYDI